MALDAIFAADMRKQNPRELLDVTASTQEERQNQGEIVGYARQIVEGIISSHADIDDRIASFSHKWSIDRMPAVDRAILRVAVGKSCSTMRSLTLWLLLRLWSLPRNTPLRSRVFL